MYSDFWAFFEQLSNTWTQKKKKKPDGKNI